MRKLPFAALTGLVLSTGAALASHDKTIFREVMIDGHRHDSGGATFWLAAAAVAMLLALWGVQRTVFRKR
ncbi:hypothetical protein [Aliiroseovarius sp.]|uniref:hypothetical protein n=1 Tax=Aliiroseovarius sp. TaxID=1872442 RepID=UPI00260D1EE7|nr:hypothetical protein [Aliiroseovarius sp.]